MKKNVLRVAFSIGAAVIALSTSAYTNAQVSVQYVNQNPSDSSNPSDFEYQPSQSCASTNPDRNCRFNVTQASAPAVGSNPTAAQISAANSGGSGNVSAMIHGDLQ